MIKRNGFAQIPLMIALLLMAIAIPVTTKWIDSSKDTRNLAAGNNVSECSKDSDCGTKAECAYCMKAGTTFKCVKGCGGVPTFKPTAGPTSKPGSGGGSGVCTKCLNGKCIAWNGSYPGDSSCASSGGTPVPKPKACAVKGCDVAGQVVSCNANTGTMKCVDSDIFGCLHWGLCIPGNIIPTSNPKSCSTVKDATECAYIPGCNWNDKTKMCSGAYPTAAPVLKACVVGGCSAQGSTQACTSGGASGVRTCNVSDGILSDCLVWSACKTSGTDTKPKACAVKGCDVAGQVVSCNLNTGTMKCVDSDVFGCLHWGLCIPGGSPSGGECEQCLNGKCVAWDPTKPNPGDSMCKATTCSAVKDATECAYIPGCYWYNNACSGVKPTIAPIATAVPSVPPGGGGGGGTNPQATPTKTSGGGGGGSCTNECPSSDGVLRSCDPVEGHSICNAVGRIAACGGTDFCCPTVGGAWTKDMTKCPTATPTVVAGSEPVLKFRMAFAGINPVAACALSKDLPLSVIVRNNDGTNKTYTGVIATKVNNTSGNLAYYDVTLRLVGFNQTGKFSVFVKSPKHLQVKYGVNNQGEYYNKAGGELDGMTSDPETTPVFSFEKYPLLAGDVTGPDGKQDGVVDGRDFVLVGVETIKRTQVDPGEYMLADLNGNCKMESQDLSLLMISLSVKQGQLY